MNGTVHWVRIGLLACLLGTGSGAVARDAKAVGERFYYSQVLPRLAENGCPKCHASGYLRPDVRVYGDVLRRLAIGDSPTNNALIYKIANLRSITPDRPNHPGGQRCASIDAEPCRTVIRWWKVEFGKGRQP